LLAGGSEDDPHFAGANPTVYTNLWLQIKSKLLADDSGSEPRRRILFSALLPGSLLRAGTLLPHRACGSPRWRACAFRKPTARC